MDDWADWELRLRLQELDDILEGNPLNARANSEYQEILNVINARLRNLDPQQGESV